jgi:hypothetical protein
MDMTGQTAPKLTLLVHSKTRGHAMLHMKFESQRDQVHSIPLVTCTPMALGIDCRGITNRVPTSNTPVHIEADLIVPL